MFSVYAKQPLRDKSLLGNQEHAAEYRMECSNKDNNS